MDSASWRLLLRVTQDYPQALIVLTSRPAADVQELSELRRLERFAEMKLSPLRSAAIESLVESVLGGRSANPELIDEIVQRAVGNPLFAREYALLLTDPPARSGISAPDRSRRSRSPHSDQRPGDGSELDRQPTRRAVPIRGSRAQGRQRHRRPVPSRVCSPACIPAILRASLSTRFSPSLTEQQLIVREETAERTFAFQHALIREVTYEQLTREQRRDLHRRVAETLEREHQRRSEASLCRPGSPLVARGGAGVNDRVRGSGGVAGARGRRVRRGRSLVEHSCIQLATDGGQACRPRDRIRWHRQIADARHGMGQLESRSAAAHQALRLAGGPVRIRTIGLVAQASCPSVRNGDCGVCFRRRGRRRMPSQTLDVARAYRHSAEVCYFNNDMLGMICDSISAVACASALCRRRRFWPARRRSSAES